MGKSERFKKGQRCYTPEGMSVEYVGAAPGGHLAVSVYVDGDDQKWPEDDTPKFHRVLYAKPRTQALAAEVQELSETIKLRREELDGIERKIAECENIRRAMNKRFKQHAALKRIDDWIEGRMTHFVTVGEYGGVAIWERDALLRDGQDRHDRSEIRLVCLFGRSNGDLQWGINRYRDGSGQWTDCFPCASEEEAKEIAAQSVRKFWESGNEYRRMAATQSAQKMGLEVPAERIKEMRDREIADAQKTVKEAEERLANAQKTLRAAAGGELTVDDFVMASGVTSVVGRVIPDGRYRIANIEGASCYIYNSTSAYWVHTDDLKRAP